MYRLPALVPAVRGSTIALAAGALCDWGHGPLPWMLGPMLAVAAARVGGWSVSAPHGGRQTGQWIIGTALGLYFTPAVVVRVGSFVWLLVLGAAFAIALGYVCGYLLVMLAGTDRQRRYSPVCQVARPKWRY